MGMKRVQPNLKKPKPRYYFREWREHRGHTQEELGEIVGVSAPSISQLENGKQGFTDSTLEAFAEALECSPADLLMRNPLDNEAIWSIWDQIKPVNRARALKTLKSFIDEDEKREAENAAGSSNLQRAVAGRVRN